MPCSAVPKCRIDSGLPAVGEVASSIGLQAVVGAIARTNDNDFDLFRTLKALAEIAMSYAGASGAGIEQLRENQISTLLVVGAAAGTPRRLPIIAEGVEIGYLSLYGAIMFGAAAADRTQVLADLAAVAFTRATHVADRTRAPMDDDRYRLITGVGHNLRNTLGAASGYMQLVEMGGELTFGQQEYASRARGAVSAAVKLIGDLIELARADAGKLLVERDVVNLNAIVRETARKHRESALAKGCDLDVTTAEKQPVITTDSSHVQQILDVLVYNAVRYTSPGTRVQVTVQVREGRRKEDRSNWACIEVRDYGAGVPDAENVFEEVHRVEHAKGNVRFKLAICRRIARLLGGDLSLETEKGTGSAFTLWLPT